jgi:formiminotetrahydrofolate cyclodeaminase
MADALKAEGNKAFAEKRFQDAVLAALKSPYMILYKMRLTLDTVTNSLKPSKSIPQIMSCTQTAAAPMHL